MVLLVFGKPATGWFIWEKVSKNYGHRSQVVTCAVLVAFILRITMFSVLKTSSCFSLPSRATTALRLKFEVCKELRNHLELLPKTGYIQAQSQFSAQLKFLPRKSLYEEAGKFFDKETGVLEAPMIIRVAEQTRPVPFTVHAAVTNSEMAFDMTNIDFGHCTIHESVKATVKLTNNSILPQQFGFVGIPEVRISIYFNAGWYCA